MLFFQYIIILESSTHHISIFSISCLLRLIFLSLPFLISRYLLPSLLKPPSSASLYFSHPIAIPVISPPATLSLSCKDNYNLFMLRRLDDVNNVFVVLSVLGFRSLLNFFATSPRYTVDYLHKGRCSETRNSDSADLRIQRHQRNYT